MPRFTIIITCYDQAAFIRDAVDSALAQTCMDREIIVVDDCSRDDSAQILQTYGTAIKFHRLENNAGASAARNQGASMAGGEFLVYLDGDDLLFPWALEVYSRIVNLKKPSMILATMLWFEGPFAKVKCDVAKNDILVVDYPAFMKKDRSWRSSASALVIERESFNQAGRWTEKFFPMEDHDLVLKLGYSGRTIQVIAPVTTAYRVHATNTTHQMDRSIDTAFKMIERERSGAYPGGRAGRFDRYVVLGGLVFWWTRKAFDLKLRHKGFALVLAGWPMIAAAMWRRLTSVCLRKHPVEKLESISQIDATHRDTVSI